MSRKYKFQDQGSAYFVTFTVVRWIDVFIRDEYREIVVDSIRHCQKHKGLIVYAWCIMTSHVHLIIGTDGTMELSGIVRDLKAFTSRSIRKLIEEHPGEIRRDWLLWMLGNAGKYNPANDDWQLWQHHSHPIELSETERAKQRLHYLHDNPVAAGFVPEPDHWRWSSAHDYCGGKGPVDIVFLY